ncbi:HalOD1 output domain-containing protein [Halobium palmae]|uniref:HalOD1 output domain-containing protein n=1 Tax=Halobium palmae TaxID=1776492 RepID=A0ABD5RYR0_9EURY
MQQGPKTSTLVLEALEECDGASLGDDDATVYEFVDLDALDAMFRRTRSPNLTLRLEAGDVSVTVWKSGEEVHVSVVGVEE